MSSQSHHACCISHVAAPPRTQIIIPPKTQQSRRGATTIDRKQVKGTARMDIQRQGNCTKRSFGNTNHKIDVLRSMSSVAAAASRNNALHALEWLRLPRLSARAKSVIRCAAIAEIPVNRIIKMAVLDAIQLNKLCSGSSIVA